MLRLFRYSLVILVLAALGFVGEPAQADPVGNFFKRLGDSIVNGPKRQAARRATRQRQARQTARKDDAGTETAVASPSPGPQALMTPEPIRRALPAPEMRGTNADLRYGVPVPDQPGFVRSPWAPTEGLVDVRGFPSGTEVKDPYTGKFFLTP